jgi:hypothetical protein
LDGKVNQELKMDDCRLKIEKASIHNAGAEKAARATADGSPFITDQSLLKGEQPGLQRMSKAGETPILEFLSVRSNWPVPGLRRLKSSRAWHILSTAMKSGSARLS